MTVWKYCVVEDHDTMKIIYNVKVKLDIKSEFVCDDIFLNDVIEYTVNSGEVLKKISEFEEQVKKREEELKQKATILSDVLNKLWLLGYVIIKEEPIPREPIVRENRCPPY
jgi:hypothetical protein